MVEEGVIEVGAFNDTFAELIPRTAKGSSRARAQLALDNRGNVRINARLTAADPDRKLNFAISPPALIAEPGTASFASIRLTPRQRFLTGPPKATPYKLLVHQDGLPTITVDGSMLQEGLLPGWLVPALIGLVALAIVATLFWFVLLKPSIQSAATAAVAPQASAAQSAAAVAKSAATNTGGAKAPATGGGGAAGANPFGGDAWADRLVGTNAITVPSGGGLSVTDLVFENPNGNSGSLQLMRFNAAKNQNQVLLSLRLENFRDLDFHFVTPLTFKENDKLELVCTPQTEGSAMRCVRLLQRVLQEPTGKLSETAAAAGRGYRGSGAGHPGYDRRDRCRPGRAGDRVSRLADPAGSADLGRSDAGPRHPDGGGGGVERGAGAERDGQLQRPERTRQQAEVAVRDHR